MRQRWQLAILLLSFLLLFGAIWSAVKPSGQWALQKAPKSQPLAPLIDGSLTGSSPGKRVAQERDDTVRSPHKTEPRRQRLSVQISPQEVLTRIPVLMYHEIGDGPTNNYLRPTEFEAQMAWLAENGYHTVTLEQVYRHINDFTPLPSKPIVLTFDDGYSSFYTTAIPVLRRYGFQATSFIITGMIGSPEHMTWQQVKQLPALQVEIGGHTVTHPDLRQLTGSRLTRELVESKRVLEEQLQIAVRFFCYPSGKYNGETPDAVKAAGYLGAVTTEYGPVTPKQNPFFWSRIRIVRGDSVAAFAQKVRQASNP